MDYEKIAEVANNIDNTIRENAALKSLIVEASTVMLDDNSSETRQSIQDFLDSPLDDKKDMVMKKAYAAAVVVAQERGLLPEMPDNGSAIASIIDEGLTRVKTSYQVGVGILDPEVAIDHIVDHAETRTVAYIDEAFDSRLVREVAADGIVKMTYMIPEVGPIIGPIAECYKPIIKSVIAKVEEPVKTAIKTGVHIIASTAKKMAHAVVEKAKEYAVNLTRKLASWLS